MLYYIFFIICFIEVINAIIKNESEFISSLRSTNEIVTININSEIDIKNEFTVNSSIKKLIITGGSQDTSKINFRYPIKFNSTLEEIFIESINITGTLFFKDNKYISLNEVDLNGYIDSDFNKNTNKNIEINNLTYTPGKESVENCIYLGGNVKINNSSFYGNSSCHNRIIHYYGLEYYRLFVRKSHFDGKYNCALLSIEKASNSLIENTTFINGYSSKSVNGGYMILKKKFFFSLLHILQLLIFFCLLN